MRFRMSQTKRKRSVCDSICWRSYGRADLNAHAYRFALGEDRFWVDVDAPAVIAVVSYVEGEGTIHHGHGRQKRAAIAQRAENRTAIWLKEVRHVKALDMPSGEIAVDLTLYGLFKLFL